MNARDAWDTLPPASPAARVLERGTPFGRLTVDDGPRIDASGSRPRAVHLVTCDCGEQRVVQTTLLVCGHTTSCGCGRRAAFERAPELHDVDGELISVPDMARRLGMSDRTLRTRMRKGLSLHDAVHYERRRAQPKPKAARARASARPARARAAPSARPVRATCSPRTDGDAEAVARRRRLEELAEERAMREEWA